MTSPKLVKRRQATRTASLAIKLDAAKWTFGAKAAGEKLRLLKQLRRTSLTRTADWLSCHDALCVMRTYPDNPRVLSAAERSLAQLARRLIRHLDGARSSVRVSFQDSGVAGSDIIHPFSLELCEALVHRYPGALEIEWDEADGESQERLLKLQTLLVTWSENDALDYDFELDARTWLTRARSRGDRTRLETLLGLFRHSEVPRAVQRQLFDDLYLPVRLRVGNLSLSRTRQRLPRSRVFYQNVPMVGRSASLRQALAAKPAPLRLLSVRRGRYYIDALQDAHAVRNRELYPVIFANPAESYLVSPGRGLEFVLFGMTPEMRLPFESNFGGMLVRNGMPLGYCIASPWFDRSEIAINVFPAYRSGESAFVFEQFANLLHHHFGIAAFFVRSHQMGEDDPEPLESGAFWFYYKLGFRAVQPRIFDLAEREMQKLKAQSGYRSSMAMLKRMSHTDVVLHADAARQSSYREPPLLNLSYAITRWYAREADGDRQEGARLAVKLLARKLGLAGTRWPHGEALAFARWAPLLLQIPDLARWSARDKAHLAALVRAKGGPQERNFVRLCQTHPRLLTSLRQLDRSIKR